jgi:exodeoxyribonuclease V alpha subunit
MENGADPAVASVVGVVDRITFANEENAWCVVRLRSNRGVAFTATGPLLGVQSGDRLRLTGRWVKHQRFGEQLEVTDYLQVLPKTLEGIRAFLGSGRIAGVGPATAGRLVEAFGMATFEVMEHEPERLTEIRGIGAKTARRITDSWVKQRSIQRIVVFLASHGVSTGIAVRLHRRYGESAVAMVRDNPYRLAEEVWGVGFLTADRIARSLGMADDAPERLAAGVVYALTEAALDGHTLLPRDELEERAAGLLERPRDEVAAAVGGLVARGGIVAVSGAAGLALKRLDRAEATVAAGVARLLRSKVSTGDAIHRDMARYERKAGIAFADGQRRALELALSRPVAVVTGGPGTGKTTLVRGIVSVLSRWGQDVLLAAPTGRAAKRLSEATGHGARTIHRMLEFNPVEGGWARNAEQPLEADAVVVDEVSMLDVELAAHLVEAVPTGCRLIFVGDADQLPSVGPGDVLADLLRVSAVPSVRLDRIFRQGAGSLIVENAHRINRGEMPVWNLPETTADFFFAVREDPEQAAQEAEDLAAERIPRRYGLDPVDEIQVLAPMHKGEAGVVRLNERLQERLAGGERGEIQFGSRRFRVGDKVMQLRNNYEHDVYNGDVGRIRAVDLEERQLRVEFGGRIVELEADDLDDLTPAYACTIHKSQGSEYPAVVVLLHNQHHVMLQRNLLYTAITRGKRLVVLVGSRKALRRAVSNGAARRRHTHLNARLERLLAQ